MTSSDTATTQILDRIAAEHRSDRTLRRFATAGWAATGLVVLALLVYVALHVRWMMQLAVIPGSNAVAMALGGLIPVVLAIGAFCALAATLATVGVLLRMRTASLHDIQLRLATLEDLLTQSASEREPK